MPNQTSTHNFGAADSIPVPVKTCLRLLRNSGYEAWLVGGCVRDLLMERTPNDYDVATSARIMEMYQVFSSNKVVDTGGIFGTLTVIIDELNIEVTTFRTESEYRDLRHPSHVTFVRSLSEDIVRRDFTINALAMDSEGHVVDEVGGVNDIRERRIRTVGEAKSRFEEDPLRILRALRFAAELEFEIDISTIHAMNTMWSLLSVISAERIHMEFKKIMCASGVTRALIFGQEILLNMFSIRDILERFRNPDEEIIRKAWNLAAEAVGSVRKDFSVRLCVLSLMADYFLELSDESVKKSANFSETEMLRAELLKNILYFLKCGKNVKTSAVYLANNLNTICAGDEYSFRTLINRLGEKTVIELIGVWENLSQADLLPSNVGDSIREIKNRARSTVEQIIANGDCCDLSCLAINGADIQNLGVPRGKVIGEVLTLCLHRVLKDPAENNKLSLVEFAKNQIELINMS